MEIICLKLIFGVTTVRKNLIIGAITVAAGGVACMIASVAFVATIPAIVTIGVGIITVGAVVRVTRLYVDKSGNLETKSENEAKEKEKRYEKQANEQREENAITPTQNPASIASQMFEKQTKALELLKAEVNALKVRQTAHERKAEVEQNLRDLDILDLKGRLLSNPARFSVLAS